MTEEEIVSIYFNLDFFIVLGLFVVYFFSTKNSDMGVFFVRYVWGFEAFLKGNQEGLERLLLKHLKQVLQY